jgi:glycosyltransferase involved in cell wall biosynthesis
LRLIIVHYHLRPGGIRRVIELATPYLLRGASSPITALTLAVGEAADHSWNAAFRRSLSGVAVDIVVHPDIAYSAERRSSFRNRARRLRAFLNRLLQRHPGSVVWAHNLGVARNLTLASELARACARHKSPLIAHHHDWWFDNRWHRWREIRCSGASTLAQVAPLTIVTGADVRHATINRDDASRLRRHLGTAVTWCPNPTGPLRAPDDASAAHAREWLNARIGVDDAPVWIFPCRLLRRKNIAEALLLTRWLRPGAWLVTTGGVSSADEQAYARALAHAARTQGWPLRLGILDQTGPEAPGVPELLGASETVLLTSIQEGFGLPYLEAAAAHRPLIARSLPGIAPDLRFFGFRFPQTYPDILVDPRLFDWNAERLRQSELFHAWRANLPRACRARADLPSFLAAKNIRPVAFSRLTLTAQLEVLGCDAAASWNVCRPLNPFLEVWRSRAQTQTLRKTPWPASASGRLGGRAYAARFHRMLRRKSPPVSPSAARNAQADFINAKLAREHLYPLLWSRD